LVVNVIHVYRNLAKGCWSIRSGGRVVAHLHRVTLRSCVMRVREGGRQRVLREGHRNVHAWIEGTWIEDAVDEGLVEIGYNPFLAPTFTLRPGFEPIHAARLVVLAETGRAYALF
jgi:hypothetical protein